MNFTDREKKLLEALTTLLAGSANLGLRGNLGKRLEAAKVRALNLLQEVVGGDSWWQAQVNAQKILKPDEATESVVTADE